MDTTTCDDGARLAALRRYGILDTAAERAFDDVAALAALVCDTTIAMVSFVDAHRQWFKARHGLELDETSRAISFCDHTIRQRDVMVVSDPAVDPRFRDNPLVTGQPGIRFYAGVPIVTSDGHAIGAVCVLDRRSRPDLSPDQIEALKSLGRQAEAQLELRFRLAQARAIAAAQRALSSVLADAGSLAEAAPHALSVMGAHMDAVVTVLWLPDDDDEALHCEAVWCADASRSTVLAADTRSRRLPRGTDLPGRVWQHGRHEWVSDVLVDVTYARAASAAAAGAGTVVAVPVLAGRLVIGVLEFFVRNELGPHFGDIALFEGLAAQFGEFMLGRQAKEVMRASEARVRQREARLDLLVRTMAEGLLFVQADGSITFANDAAGRITGVPASTLQLTRLDDPRWRMFRDDGLPYSIDDLPATIALRTGEAVSNAVVGIGEVEDQRRWLKVNVEPVCEGPGTPVFGAVITFTDITDHKQAEASLEAARDQAESATRAKSEFLAVMSHEIRTPMNGVLGMLNRATELASSPEQRRVLQLAQHSAEMLLGITNDVLDFSRISAGRLELEETPFDACALVDSVAESLAPQARRGVVVRVMHAHGHLGGALGDPGRLRQILLNLCGNAVKFTRRGHVEIRTSRVQGATGPLFRFAVEDTGIGIPEERRATIFDAFTQADASTTRQFGGSGLGLSICGRLATLMGGTVTLVQSSLSGSTFELLLPLQAVDVPLAPARQPHAARTFSGRVLVVDDNFINQQVAVAMLRRGGCTVDVAGGGEEAIEMVTRFGYDLVLMDCRMPGLDGYDTTRALRRMGLRSLPIVAMTASVLAGDRERCLEAGMNDYLTKPVMQVALEDMLARHLASAEDASAPATPTATDWAPDRMAQMRAIFMARGGDGWHQLTDAFLTNCRDVLPRLERDTEQGDLAGVREQAHQLKGSAGMVGAGRLAQLSHEVERAAMHGDASAIPGLLGAVRIEVRSVERLLTCDDA